MSIPEIEKNLFENFKKFPSQCSLVWNSGGKVSMEDISLSVDWWADDEVKWNISLWFYFTLYLFYENCAFSYPGPVFPSIFIKIHKLVSHYPVED